MYKYVILGILYGPLQAQVEDIKATQHHPFNIPALLSLFLPSVSPHTSAASASIEETDRKIHVGFF